MYVSQLLYPFRANGTLKGELCTFSPDTCGVLPVLDTSCPASPLAPIAVYLRMAVHASGGHPTRYQVAWKTNTKK